MVVISMSKKKVNKKRNLIAKQNTVGKPNLQVISNPRLEALQNRELIDDTEEQVIETVDTEEFVEKEVSKFRLGVTWFLTIVIGTLITYLLVVLGAQLTAGVTAMTLAYQSVLSSDAILVSSTAFTTSIVWALVFKVKLYERLFKLFSRRFGGK
jgi:hypothetical protein